MAFTTNENIRVQSGFQSRFMRQSFENSPDGGATTFFVKTDDNIKFVPEFGTGNTTAGVSDVQVYVGLSAQFGASRMNVSSINSETGAVTLDAAPDSGASVTVNYSSSSIEDREVNEKSRMADGAINARLALCYGLPLSPVPTTISDLAGKAAAALLLIKHYGVASRSTSADGYMLYSQVFGDNTGVIARGTKSAETATANVGEIGLICSPNYQIVDDSGNILSRNDADSIDGDSEFKPGGRVTGRIHDITEETFRKKKWQKDADRPQPGSGMEAQSTTNSFTRQ